MVTTTRMVIRMDESTNNQGVTEPEVGKTYKLVARLTDTSKVGIASKAITFYMDGTALTPNNNTSSSGYASRSWVATTGSHVWQAKFAGDTTYAAIDSDKLTTVSKAGAGINTWIILIFIVALVLFRKQLKF